MSVDTKGLAEDVVKFFLDRKGFDEWWYGIDQDVRDEIVEDLADEIAITWDVE